MATTATTTLAGAATPTPAIPKLTLYTNHGCPWAHRVHIALRELGLSYDEVIIDLDRPREEWFYKINPRGIVPAMRYSNGQIDEVITESAIIAQFLADAHPSHLVPASNDSPAAALFRVRINFFVDTYFTRVNPLMWACILGAPDKQKREEKAADFAKAVEKDIEPLLSDAAPYFGGSEKLTLAEVQIASFILRVFDFADDIIFPKSVVEPLRQLPNFSKWAAACTSHESVLYIWDKEVRVQRVRDRLEMAKKIAGKKYAGQYE
ncbi:thioredoxin-like protein [Xylona heveae TC161]|uniref:Thioredoxin-like protein n=1 Tax=Xylona heveae (strain CBS 132557 / TC161) TaxID=1328760 RepID=A0A165I8V0_XYLHT|nr:thioredoxin-like protein [Xylona heveae TC161]KZF24555.1 thioredoxin-like protein [Xylona heveae TC161]